VQLLLLLRRRRVGRRVGRGKEGRRVVGGAAWDVRWIH